MASAVLPRHVYTAEEPAEMPGKRNKHGSQGLEREAKGPQAIVPAASGFPVNQPDHADQCTGGHPENEMKEKRPFRRCPSSCHCQASRPVIIVGKVATAATRKLA
jgi:hypothetical protein